MEGIEADLTRLRAARRVTEDTMKKEQDRAEQVQGQFTRVLTTLKNHFHNTLEVALTDFGNRLRDSGAVGMRSVYFDGSHVMIPTDYKMSACSADKRELACLYATK